MQIYALALAEALSKNCEDPKIHVKNGKNVLTHVNREISSKSFTQGLERIVTDRVRHKDLFLFLSI